MKAGTSLRFLISIAGDLTTKNSKSTKKRSNCYKQQTGMTQVRGGAQVMRRYRGRETGDRELFSLSSLRLRSRFPRLQRILRFAPVCFSADLTTKNSKSTKKRKTSDLLDSTAKHANYAKIFTRESKDSREFSLCFLP